MKLITILLTLILLMSCGAPTTEPVIEVSADPAVTCELTREGNDVLIIVSVAEARARLGLQVDSLGPIEYNRQDVGDSPGFTIGALSPEEPWKLSLIASELVRASVFQLTDQRAYLNPCWSD